MLPRHSRKASKRHESTLAIWIDLSAAFDITDQSCAIKQMIKIGVPNNIVRRLHGFINNRNIQVFYKSKRSRKRKTRLVLPKAPSPPLRPSKSRSTQQSNFSKNPRYHRNMFGDDFLVYTTA
jgi:hypothetical protein